MEIDAVDVFVFTPANMPITEGASQVDDLGEIPDYWVQHIKEAALNADSGSLLTLRSHIIAAMAEIQRERKVKAGLEQIVQRHLEAFEMTDVSGDVITNVIRVLAAHMPLYHQMGAIQDIVTRFENELHSGYAGSLPNRVQMVYNRLERKAWSAEQDFKHFRNDTHVWLRAVGIIAASISNAGTHAEKNARLRGLIEMIESAIGDVRKAPDRDDAWGVHTPDIFRSDYPVRDYVQRIHQLEHELEMSKKPKEDSSDKDEEFAF